MTEAQKQLWEKLERLKRKRAFAPSVALGAEIKATADRIALLEAVRQSATEPAIGPVVAEWVPTPDEPGESEVVDLHGGKTIEDYLHERGGDSPPAAYSAAQSRCASSSYWRCFCLASSACGHHRRDVDRKESPSWHR